MPKSDAEVANINARSAISTARTMAAIGNAIGKVPIEQLTVGTIESAIKRAWSVGWAAGAKDAMRN